MEKTAYEKALAAAEATGTLLEAGRLIKEGLELLKQVGGDVLSVSYDNTWTKGRITVHVSDPNAVLHALPGELEIRGFYAVDYPMLKSKVTRRLGDLEIMALSEAEPQALEEGGQ